ncbi:hypothetical protein B9Z46_08005 [Limnohabitans sp. Hippo4]|nr:hypothetical protein B9Z46_08005 [Limnohabitans sp. Hippo4]
MNVNGDVKASGSAFNLDPAINTIIPINWSGTYNAKTAKVSFDNGTSMTQDVPQSPAVQTEVTGTWASSVGNPLIGLTFVIDSQGVLTGNSTTGCTYAGLVAVRPESFVYDTRVTEACPNKTQVLLNGIASLSANKANLTFTLLTVDRLYAKALFFGKP